MKHSLEILAILVALGFTVVQWRASELQNTQQIRSDFTQLAIGILARSRENDEDDNPMPFKPEEVALREWAVNLLESYNEIKIPENTRSAVIDGSTSLPVTSSYGSYTPDPKYSDLYSGSSPSSSEMPKEEGQ